MGNLTGNIMGNIMANLTVDLTGNLTGNFTGNIMGNLMGNIPVDFTGNLTGNLTKAVQFREGCQAEQRKADILSLNWGPPSIHQTKIKNNTLKRKLCKDKIRN